MPNLSLSSICRRFTGDHRREFQVANNTASRDPVTRASQPLCAHFTLLSAAGVYHRGGCSPRPCKKLNRSHSGSRISPRVSSPSRNAFFTLVDGKTSSRSTVCRAIVASKQPGIKFTATRTDLRNAYLARKLARRLKRRGGGRSFYDWIRVGAVPELVEQVDKFRSLGEPPWLPPPSLALPPPLSRRR